MDYQHCLDFGEVCRVKLGKYVLDRKIGSENEKKSEPMIAKESRKYAVETFFRRSLLDAPREHSRNNFSSKSSIMGQP